VVQELPLLVNLIGGPLLVHDLAYRPSDVAEGANLLLQLGDAREQVLADELTEILGGGFFPLHFKTYM
jgi:hypothetical protein